MINQHQPTRTEPYRLYRTEEHVVAANGTHIDDATIESHRGRSEHGAASRQHRPFACHEPFGATHTRAACKHIGEPDAIISQRVHAEHAVLHHQGIGLTTPIEANENCWWSIGH